MIDPFFRNELANRTDFTLKRVNNLLSLMGSTKLIHTPRAWTFNNWAERCSDGTMGFLSNANELSGKQALASSPSSGILNNSFRLGVESIHSHDIVTTKISMRRATSICTTPECFSLYTDTVTRPLSYPQAYGSENHHRCSPHADVRRFVSLHAVYFLEIAVVRP
jgi:hypothetical protein